MAMKINKQMPTPGTIKESYKDDTEQESRSQKTLSNIISFLLH